MWTAQAAAPLLIEGYASLFGVEDLAGDVVRAGAFARTLARGAAVAMLLQHRAPPVGAWTVLREDGRGLLVRGLVEGRTAAGRALQALIEAGSLDGLSIGFVARSWRPRGAHGRDLLELQLREVSLVSSPMLPAARFRVVASAARPLVNAA